MEDFLVKKNAVSVIYDIRSIFKILLGKIIKEGAISDIPSIHRVTIDGAIRRKVERP